jgi:hypothetical protein
MYYLNLSLQKSILYTLANCSSLICDCFINFFCLLDCIALPCEDPKTNSPPGTCLCVLPIKVELRFAIELYTFFTLVAELAQDIASGLFMNQSQVRVMGANAAPEDPGKTVVLIDLVPMGEKFDNATAFLVFERFWHKQIIINRTRFGNYDVLYVKYSGESSPCFLVPVNISFLCYRL